MFILFEMLNKFTNYLSEHNVLFMHMVYKKKLSDNMFSFAHSLPKSRHVIFFSYPTG